jgi:ABC-type Fe3+ transport system permease subunit
VNSFWSYFWPLIAAGLVIGAIAGTIGFRMPRAQAKAKMEGEAVADDRKRRRWLSLAIGVLACVGAAALWYGPMGAAKLLAFRVERDARITLNNYEIPEVSAHLHRNPLSRRLILSGPANDFQRGELVRIMPHIPGIREARWSNAGGGVPLIVESIGAAILGYLFGLLLAYLVELRRRYNAQWNW